MTEKQWRECLGELVRDYIRSPELEYYFSIKMNKPRAGVMVKQQSLFVRHRRECWSHVSASCPIMGVKQRILEHEYEEIIRDAVAGDVAGHHGDGLKCGSTEELVPCARPRECGIQT